MRCAAGELRHTSGGKSDFICGSAAGLERDSIEERDHGANVRRRDRDSQRSGPADGGDCIAAPGVLMLKDFTQAEHMDGRLEISNNRAERSINSFVIGRKNFLFANTVRGAKASVVMYSFI